MDERRTYSVLDFVRSQKIYGVCRILFCASTTRSSDSVLKFFIAYAKEQFANGVTGLLLVYPDYVVHLLEATEDEIFKLCSCLVNVNPNYIENSKCFPIEVNVEQRFFSKWYGRKVAPDTKESLGQLSDNFDNVTKIYSRLMNDLYSFYNELRTKNGISQACLMDKLDALSSQRDPLLPDETTLKSILQSHYGDSLESLVENYWYGICPNEWDDEVWPFRGFQCPPLDP